MIFSDVMPSAGVFVAWRWVTSAAVVAASIRRVMFSGLR
jgi:hypothetical protein